MAKRVRDEMESPDPSVAAARALTKSVAKALAWQEQLPLQDLTRRLVRFAPSTEALRVTGLGRLVNDAVAWSVMDEHHVKLIGAVVSKWKELVKTIPMKPKTQGTTINF